MSDQTRLAEIQHRAAHTTGDPYWNATDVSFLLAHVLALTEARDHLQQELGYANHELSLIRADVAAEQTDCSTPIFQLVRNRSERVAKLEAQVQALDVAASWQPIATAPKDQRWLLLCDDKGGPPYVGRWFIWAGRSPDDGFWQSHAVRMYPTHWLPAPPAAARPEEPT